MSWGHGEEMHQKREGGFVSINSILPMWGREALEQTMDEKTKSKKA